ncbi:MAG: cyclase family protein [Pyrinomonadaceae bacterium]
MIRLQLDGREIEFDESSPIDISIPMNFNGQQPNAYGVKAAFSEPVRSGDLVGDTRLGGSCNFEQYTFIPHCNGTHTECVGHITNERIAVVDCLQDVFIEALLVSVESESTKGSNDLVITRKSVDSAIKSAPGALPLLDTIDTLIVRSLPNDENKLTRQYDETLPPYFKAEAIEFIVEIGIRHLLVDLPSIDRMYDNGQLSNHRIFWSIDQGAFETNEKTRIKNTITEMIYVPNTVKDGRYLLNLQVAPFMSDASPSRPILFRIKLD